jgi:hypothetical protein
MALPGNADGTPGSYEGRPPPSSSAATYNDKDGNTSKAGDSKAQKSSKKINNAQTAETVAIEPQGELLRYPLVNNYFASMTYRMKTINPWDVDLATAKKIFEKTLLWDLSVKDNKKEEKETESNYEIDGVQTAEERARARLAGEEDDQSAAGAEAASFKKRKKDRERSEAAAEKGILGVTTSYVPGASQVSLYMPQAINFQENIQYDTPELGAGGAAALAVLNNAGGLGDAASRLLKEAFAPLTDLFNAELTGQAARLAASRAASAYLPQGAAAAAQIGLQVKLNPNQRTLFSGVTIRPFTFQYDFVATSRVEADQINKIIRFFRTQMYPSTFGRNETSIPLGYKFPDLFEIKFRWGDTEMNIPQPLLCYLRDVQVTYNPGSMSFHADGNATHIQMTLVFQEFRALTREDIERGH